MTEPDPKYFKAALETLDLIKRLLEHHTQNQTKDEFQRSLSQIEAKADIEVKTNSRFLSTDLSRSLKLDLPDKEIDTKTSIPWQGVRDMARIVYKRWNQGNHEFSAFRSLLLKMEEALMIRVKEMFGRNILVEEANPLEDLLDKEDNDNMDPSTPTPFVYNPPPPPAGKAVAQEKPKISLEITDSPDEYIPQEEMSKRDSKPLAQQLLEKDEDEDAMLSKSLKDALRILRDED